MYLGFTPLLGNLPVFVRAEADSALYYAPGYVLRAAAETRNALEAEILGGVPRMPLAVELLRHAQAAKVRWAALTSRSYDPLCLTLYLDNRCNLRCSYCYSDPASGQGNSASPLKLDAVHTAAELVAQNCRARELPFNVVIHGGGEPTLNARLLAAALDDLDVVAASFGLKIFKYLATNGVMPVARIRWVAANFNLVGLSCDGPAEIQNYQRPLMAQSHRGNGRNSASYVERTADIFHEMDLPFHVRVTVTPQVSSHQEEIIEYICRRLAPQEIHLEPVYTGGREQAGFVSEEHLVETFVRHFLNAQSRARAYSTPLQFSGSRPWDVHGPFCQIFRDVLQLVPGEVASPCFKLSDAGQVSALDAGIGWDTGEEFALDRQKVSALRVRLRQQPDTCQSCFNQYHCARACPDGCGLEQGLQSLPSFRCQVQMRLSAASIERAASALIVSSTAPLAAAPITIGV